MKKNVTEKQREANQQNSQKSTGPKTSEGKRAVRQNAVTRGLFVKLADLGPSEDRTYLIKGLLKEWQPVNVTDQMLITEAVDSFLALQHLHRLQAGAMVVETKSAESELPELEGIFQPGGAGWPLVELMGKVIYSLAKTGRISNEVRDELSKEFPGWQGRVSDGISW